MSQSLRYFISLFSSIDIFLSMTVSSSTFTLILPKNALSISLFIPISFTIFPFILISLVNPFIVDSIFILLFISCSLGNMSKNNSKLEG